MQAIARFTGIALIVLGIVVMIAGLAGGAYGAFNSATQRFNTVQGALPLRPARAGGIVISLMIGAFVFVQGVMVAGAGQGLYLLADLSRRLALPSASS